MANITDPNTLATAAKSLSQALAANFGKSEADFEAIGTAYAPALLAYGEKYATAADGDAKQAAKDEFDAVNVDAIEDVGLVLVDMQGADEAKLKTTLQTWAMAAFSMLLV